MGQVQKFRIFISWHGKLAQEVAVTLQHWLRHVLQATDPFCSVTTPVGVDWRQHLHDQLDRADMGVACLTSESLKAPWVAYETGALLARQKIVCPLLIGIDPKAQPIPEPYRALHHSLASDDQSMRAFVERINGFLKERGDYVEPEVLNASFGDNWSKFSIPHTKAVVEARERGELKTDSDKLDEILGILRQNFADRSPGGSPASGVLPASPQEVMLRINADRVQSEGDAPEVE